MTDPNAYICGGYFLVKRIPRPKDISDLIPETFLTLSDCFTDIAPDIWAFEGYNVDDEERSAEALKFGITGPAVREMVSLLTHANGALPANAFPHLSVAQEFYRHSAPEADIALLGIGLEPSLMSSLYAQRDDDVNRGYGLIERLELMHPLQSGGERLGYEPLGFEATKFHSWLCHNEPSEASQRFGVRPNRYGFIESFEDAVRVTKHLKTTGATTAIWEPWLIVQYTAA